MQTTILDKQISAYLADLAYFETNAEFMAGIRKGSFKRHKLVDIGPYRFVVAQYHMTTFIAFRGTDNGSNWLTDARIFPTYKRGYGWVHKGFYSAFSKCRARLHSELLEYFEPQMRYVFCGHSLGGAMAQLAGLWFGREFTRRNLQIISFGSPKVGMGSFRRLIRGTEHIRYYNDDDPVTHVPGRWLYKHYQTAGEHVVDHDNDILDFSEHSMALYRKLVESERLKT